MTVLGHEDQFRPPSLNGRYRLGDATFCRASGNDEVAPTTVIRPVTADDANLSSRAHSVGGAPTRSANFDAREIPHSLRMNKRTCSSRLG
jgi:hypothetical protein